MDESMQHLVKYQNIFRIHLGYLLISHRIDLNYVESVQEYRICEFDKYDGIINNINGIIEIIDNMNKDISLSIANAIVILKSYIKIFDMHLITFVRTNSIDADCKLSIKKYRAYVKNMPSWYDKYDDIKVLISAIENIVNIIC
jgi:hypothetical protein